MVINMNNKQNPNQAQPSQKSQGMQQAQTKGDTKPVNPIPAETQPVTAGKKSMGSDNENCGSCSN
jgi:hypothetical protein